MNTLFACVDLGCTKSAAVVVEAMNGGEARVLGFGQSQCRGLRKGIIVDLDEAARSLLAALRKAEQMANRRVDKIFVNTTGPDVSTQNTHGVVPIMPANRTITREDVHRALRHSRQVILPPDRCLLHATPRWFHLDGAERVSDPLGKTGVRLEVSTHLITTSSRQIENLEQCALKAQVEIEQIVFSGLASGMSVTTRTERAKRVAVVDMGAGTTDIAVYGEGGVLGISFVPVGGHHVTSDISKLLNTSFDEAEHLKLTVGTCFPESVSSEEVVPIRQVGVDHERPFPREVLAEIIEARVRETLCLVKQQVDKICGEENQVEAYVLTGGGTRMQGMLPLAQRVFAGITVRLAHPRPLPGASEHVAMPEFATLLGLVQFAMENIEESQLGTEVIERRGWLSGIATIFSHKK